MLSAYPLCLYARQEHERRSLHRCDQCDKVFLRRLHLDDHLRTHNGDRPYTCDVCGRGFSQRGNLRTHAMLHTVSVPAASGRAGSGGECADGVRLSQSAGQDVM